jgi:hypothetical protein
MASGPLAEKYVVTKTPSWRQIIACVDTEGCPVSSMIRKGDVPDGVLDSWHMEQYPDPGHTGVRDLVDASNFQHQKRVPVSCLAQKVWYPFKLSDFMDVTKVVAVRDEFAKQQSHGMVGVKRMIEKRLLSDAECQVDDGTKGNETRGLFKWIQNTAQSVYPVPDGWRTPSAQIYTSTLAALREDNDDGSTTFLSMMRSAFSQRKTASTLKGICGIDLKSAISHWSIWNRTTTTGSFPTNRTTTLGAKDNVLMNVIDRLESDAGTVDLMKSAFLDTDATTGAASATASKKGLFLDMDMVEMAFLRNVRVFPLPYAGGGKAAVIDAIFCLRVLNALGMIAVKCSG